MQQNKLSDPSHPLKQEIKQLKISQNSIAHCVGIPHQRFFRYLNGYAPMPNNLEKTLRTIIDSIKKEVTNGVNA
jgi:hypothetical protein